MNHNNISQLPIQRSETTTSSLCLLQEDELEVLEARLKILLTAYLYFGDYRSIKNNNLENGTFNQQ